MINITSLTKELIRKRIININFHLLLSVLFLSFLSCESFIEVDPPNSRIVSETVFNDDNTATAAVTGIYSEMMANVSNFAGGSYESVTALSGLSADELVDNYSNSTRIEFYQNVLNSTNFNVQSLWSTAYKTIYNANAVLEGLANSTGVTLHTKEQLQGEAKFVRAFCHFYLVNLFGDVPLVMTTDYRENAVASRTPILEVYNQIIKDLEDAQIKLDDEYVTAERVRPNKFAATALLARVYLYMKDWANAEIQATDVIDNSARYSLVDDLNNVFLANSSEAIWQLMPVSTTINTNEGDIFILTDNPQFYTLSSYVINSIELGDKRLTSWVGSYDNGSEVFYYPYKYKIKSSSTLTEYSMVLRLAEQYLIRAEARAKQDKLTGINSAESDINIIRNRAGLENTIAITKDQLLAAIEQERKVELFTEWGHRWLDLKRTNRADAVLDPLKPEWQSTDVLYPIPEQEIISDRNLAPQNPGY